VLLARMRRVDTLWAGPVRDPRGFIAGPKMVVGTRACQKTAKAADGPDFPLRRIHAKVWEQKAKSPGAQSSASSNVLAPRLIWSRPIAVSPCPARPRCPWRAKKVNFHDCRDQSVRGYVQTRGLNLSPGKTSS